jgi:hypothetical protein
MIGKLQLLCCVVLMLVTGGSFSNVLPNRTQTNPYQSANPQWSYAPIKQSSSKKSTNRNLFLPDLYPLPLNRSIETSPISGDGANFRETTPIGNQVQQGPVFSQNPMMNPMMSMMNPMMNPMMAMHNPLMNPFHPAHYIANSLLHNPHSLTRMTDDEDNEKEESDFGNSLSRSAFPELRVKNQCESVQRQALQVANNLIKRQNKVMFKEIMNYLLKSKFLIGLTEIKLSKILKQKFLGVIKKFSGLTEDNVRLIHSADDELLDDDFGMSEETDDTESSLFEETTSQYTEPKVEAHGELPFVAPPVVKEPVKTEPTQEKPPQDNSWWNTWFKGRKLRSHK